MRRICVFCGSKIGSNTDFRYAAETLGREIVRRGLGLVYGGGSVGLMGVIADVVLESGGEVIGVIPEPLATKELMHPEVSQMIVVPNMHARKSRMAELSDLFIAMPGGYGTLEELFEVISWAQLGIHFKPIGLLNTAGYFDPLMGFIDHAITQDFIKSKYRELFVITDQPEALLDELVQYEFPEVRQWIRSEQV